MDASTLLALVVASNGGSLTASTLPLMARDVPKVLVERDWLREGVIVKTTRKVAPPPKAIQWRLIFRNGGTKE